MFATHVDVHTYECTHTCLCESQSLEEGLRFVGQWRLNSLCESQCLRRGYMIEHHASTNSHGRLS